MSEKDELKKFLPTLRALCEQNVQFVLVAGHAVSFWGEKYSAASPSLQDKAPFVSKDLDLLSTTSELAKIQHIFPQLEALPWKRDLPLFAILTTEEGQRIDFLRSIYGVMSENIFSRSITSEYDGLNIHVADPITLFKAKASNTANLDQTERNDMHQLTILADVIPCYFREIVCDTLQKSLPERSLIREIKLFIDLFKNTSVVKGCRLAEINLPSLFPLTELTSPDLEKCPRFLENTLAPWLAATGEMLNAKS